MATDGAPRADMSLGGRYRLTRQVGAGGMGVVFEATNTWTSRRVAIKCLTAQAVDGRAKTLGED
jgi:serine/threonine protein kinase